MLHTITRFACHAEHLLRLPAQEDWDEEKEPEGFLLEGSVPEATAAGAVAGPPCSDSCEHDW